ncbi:type I restriction-modification system subunit M [bacterium]|nr:type I restriction-modification system subunit M [bacterium]
MAIKKNELYSSLWASCDELRGGMDASQYKDYVLTLLFVKYASDKSTGKADDSILVKSGSSFTDIIKIKNDKEIGDKINKIIGRLAKDNDLQGVIDIADFNDEDKLGKGKEMVDRLTKLAAIFEGLDLGSNRAGDDDLLGDAYEFLMRHFATESGKSKGQFYTPAEVSIVMSEVIGIDETTSQKCTIYDPTCGSGSLLLKANDQAPRGLSIYGQENDNATYALARMNMFLHNAPYAEIWKGNTLSSPHFKNPDSKSLKQFDFAVANPPFSYKSWSTGIKPTEDQYQRFEYGVPPAKNGDYAFLLHIIKSLKSTGKGAIILPHGVLFRGNTESDIRRNLIKQGYIKGIIGLPANLFYGTGIPACIIVIDKQHAQARRGIFMIDASKGFMKDGNKNRLRSQDIHKIVDIFTKQSEVAGYSRMVPFAEIEKNEFNLNIPRYIDSSEPEDLHDLPAHLKGGIPEADIEALDKYWKLFPNVRNQLFAKGNRAGYIKALVPANQVKANILKHEEYQFFSKGIMKLYKAWEKEHKEQLEAIKIKDKPKELINKLSENLLATFFKAKLINPYDIYQHLMDYWSETMQDDVYIIVQDGWQAGKQVRKLEKPKNGEKQKETPDLIIDKLKFKMDLIPPQLIVNRFFSKEQQALDELQSDKDTITQELESFIEEHSGEESVLEDAKNDKGKITKATLKTTIAEVKNQEDNQEEMAVLTKCHELMEKETEASNKIKTAQKVLGEKVLAKYQKVTIDEIKTLIIEDKWLATMKESIESEIERITQQLATRIKVLEERYAEPLAQLVEKVETLSVKVDAHLKKMGLQWN